MRRFDSCPYLSMVTQGLAFNTIKESSTLSLILYEFIGGTKVPQIKLWSSLKRPPQKAFRLLSSCFWKAIIGYFVRTPSPITSLTNFNNCQPTLQFKNKILQAYISALIK